MSPCLENPRYQDKKGSGKMDLNQLKYFEVIAKYQNMSRAQEILHIAQPALSTGLSRLENQLGVKLFNRTKGRLELNDYGKIFLKYVVNINADYEKALKEIEAEKKRFNNTLNIAVLDMGFSLTIMPDFTLIYPDIKLNPHIIARDPEEDISLDEYDIIITPLPETFPNMKYLPILREELSLAVPSTHRLFEKASVSLYDLAGEVMYCVGFRSHFSFFVKKMLAEAGVVPASFNFCIAADIAPQLKNHNAVSAVLPGVYRMMTGQKDLHLLPFNPPIFRQTGIAYPSMRKQSAAAKSFCDFACGYWQDS